MLNPDISHSYIQEYFPDIFSQRNNQNRKEKESPKKSSMSPLLTQKSFYDFAELREDCVWNYDSSNFLFNVLSLKTVENQLILTLKVLMTKANIEKFMVSISKFYQFWQDLKRKYDKRQNFFHNFEHGLNGNFFPLFLSIDYHIK